MGIENSNSAILFGRNKTAAAAQVEAEPLKKSDFWLNVGLTKVVEGQEIFIALPLGIALDTQARLSETSSNKAFAQMQAARNAFMDALVEYGKANLKPGEDEVVVGLEVQLRRVREITPVSTGTDNPFMVQFNIGEKAEA